MGELHKKRTRKPIQVGRILVGWTKNSRLGNVMLLEIKDHQLRFRKDEALIIIQKMWELVHDEDFTLGAQPEPYKRPRGKKKEVEGGSGED